MKNDLKVVQISEAINGYIVTLVEKNGATDFTRDCRIHIAQDIKIAMDMCENFLLQDEKGESK